MHPEEHPVDVDAIVDLGQARARIRVLERKLDEAIELLVRRDAQLEAHERRIALLEDELESAREAG